MMHTSLTISLEISLCSSTFQSRFSSFFVKCLFVDCKCRSKGVFRVKQTVLEKQINREKEYCRNFLYSLCNLLTANASVTVSNCFDTDATAFAILCLVTNMTSENDHPCIKKEGKILNQKLMILFIFVS